MKRIAIIILLLVGVLAVSILPNIFASNTDTFEETTISDKFRQMNVRVSNANVEVLPTDRGQAEVHLSDKKSHQNLQAAVKGEVLEVKVKDRRFFRFFEFNFFSAFSQPTLTIYLPREAYDSIFIETDNGKVILADVTADELRMKTDNGAINLTNIQSTTIFAETDNGRIEMDRVEGDISAETDNGKIIFFTKSLDYSIELETDNGAIEVETEEAPTNNTFDIQTDNGAITVFGNSLYDTIIGDGEHLIKLKTDNGRITVSQR